jgi:GntR family transcriptional regulator
MLQLYRKGVRVTEQKEDDRPRYQQVAEDLRAKITDGRFAIGAQLPTENDLCSHYAVSRFTVREALRVLAEDGLITRKRGSGTLVAPADGPRRLRQRLSNVNDLLQYAHDTEFDFMPVGDIFADDRLVRLIGCAPRSQWIAFTGVRRSASFERPVCYTEVYVDPRFENASTRLKTKGEAIFYQLSQLYDVEVAQVTQELQAVPAGKTEGRVLRVDLHAPCLRIVRTYWDNQGTPIEYSINTHPGDLFSYAMVIDANRFSRP